VREHWDPWLVGVRIVHILFMRVWKLEAVGQVDRWTVGKTVESCVFYLFPFGL